MPKEMELYCPVCGNSIDEDKNQFYERNKNKKQVKLEEFKTIIEEFIQFTKLKPIT